MKYFYVFLLALTIGSCQSRIVYDMPNQTEKSEIIKFAKHIGKIASLNQPEHFLKHVEPKYMKEQLAVNLDGNKEQFLNEFFCGNIGEQYKCFKFSNILTVKLTHIIELKDKTVQLKYHIVNEDKLELDAEIYLTKIDTNYFIYSALG